MVLSRNIFGTDKAPNRFPIPWIGAVYQSAFFSAHKVITGIRTFGNTLSPEANFSDLANLCLTKNAHNHYVISY